MPLITRVRCPTGKLLWICRWNCSQYCTTKIQSEGNVQWHKRVHAIKFQSVVLPNGLIGNLAGPFEGKRHDSTMLHESGLLTSLEQVAFFNNHPLCLYGYPAYSLGVHLQAPFRNVEITPEMQEFNRESGESFC